MNRRREIFRILLVGLVAIGCAFAMEAKKDKKDAGEARIQFEEDSYNFGNIKERGGSVSHEFGFINTGNGKLVIVDATAECGCTRPEYPKNPISPAKKGKIKVTFNPIGRPGSFTKVVTVKTNGHPKKVRLKIKGTVIP